jgi:hypothetical protein
MTKRIKDLTEEQREKKRAYQRKYLANLTEEQREKRRAYKRKYYANLTEEQKRKYYPPLTEEQREKKRANGRKYYKDLTEEQREKRRANNREWYMDLKPSSGLTFFKIKLSAIRSSVSRKKKQILKDKLAGNGKKQDITLASIEVDVTPEYLMSIFPKDGKCPVLNIPFTFNVGKSRRFADSNIKSFASLDRVDNNKGYIKGNVVWVSWKVNSIKSDLTLEELFKISQFYMNWKKKCHEEK